MSFPKIYNRVFVYAIIFTVVVTIAAIFIYSSLSKWQANMVEKNKLICEFYAEKLLYASINDINTFGSKGLLGINDVASSENKRINTVLKKLSAEQLKEEPGLEGGFYLRGPDEFYGYSFPTSPPPEPLFGPPPRSYNIIKTQCLKCIEENRPLINLHSFNAAIFPLVTKPIIYNSKVVGVVWVRIHIENDLPIIKLKQVVNAVAVVSILGFLVLMLISALWGGEIQGIKMEMENIRHNSAFRLKKRWGIFGYISSNINEMLDTIEKDNRKRHKLERQLNQKEKLASLGNMIAGVAHEVKTPLAIIKTRIQMWQQDVQKSKEIAEHISPESMQMVIDEINRMSNLVKRLLIFSRPIEKKMKPTNINKLVGEVINFINIDKNNNDISVELELSPDIPLIPADENSIKQVLMNVLDNSIEAMTNGGKIVVVSKPDIDNDKIILQISDTGEGIPEEIMNKIFEPFFTSKVTGSGLGLAISYEIIKAHNGEISFLKNDDLGTKCIIKLPVHQ
ncbi:MAG: ATP-binding protein [Prolixibacteraceae bacterium]